MNGSERSGTRRACERACNVLDTNIRGVCVCVCWMLASAPNITGHFHEGTHTHIRYILHPSSCHYTCTHYFATPPSRHDRRHITQTHRSHIICTWLAYYTGKPKCLRLAVQPQSNVAQRFSNIGHARVFAIVAPHLEIATSYGTRAAYRFIYSRARCGCRFVVWLVRAIEHSQTHLKHANTLLKWMWES